MKPTKLAFYILAIALIIYGYWGVFTKSGSRYYDEMSGMIPWFLMLLGIALMIGLLLWEIWKYFFK